jgi:hypothetical protein
MALCGVARIDDLLAGRAAVEPIGPNDADHGAVGVIQDFLICQGFRAMPGLLSKTHGTFGPATVQCVQEYQQRCALPATGKVDKPTLRALIDRQASAPVAAQCYLTLVLDVQYAGVTRLMSLTSQFEGGGRFGAINRNTDEQGLSFGLIQWAQRPGRLTEILTAFRKADPPRFARILGAGDAALGDKLIAHTSKPHGGTAEQGKTVDPAFDLVQDPWLTRFREAALDPAFQRVQVTAAVAAFDTSLTRLRAYAPQLKSERSVAFMLDLANQHGDGGARGIFQAVGGRAAFTDDAAFLTAMENESVRRVRAQYGDGNETESTSARRTGFRTSPLLSDTPLSA